MTKKKIGKIVSIIGLSLVAIVAILFALLLLASSGKLPPLTDSAGKPIVGSISEKGKTIIGGIPQGFFIRSENPENPVLLYLHGGPGSPALPFLLPAENSERPEKYFTVCYWDQRGAGMTYHKDAAVESMRVSQMVEDTREMTEYLLQRFGGQKIYITGHSWGSYLGLKTIEKYPHLYAAYIGLGQVTNQLESELLAYDYMLTHAQEIGDTKAVKQLGKFDKTAKDFPTNEYLMQIRTPLMDKYKIGTMHENVSMVKMAMNILLFKGYTFAEKIGYFRGMSLSMNTVWNELVADNLFESSPQFQIPVYFVQGAYDYLVSHTLAQKYMDILQAPKKQFYSFENSAHFPHLEESAHFVQVLQEIAAENPINTQ